MVTISGTSVNNWKNSLQSKKNEQTANMFLSQKDGKNLYTLRITYCDTVIQRRDWCIWKNIIVVCEIRVIDGKYLVFLMGDRLCCLILNYQGLKKNEQTYQCLDRECRYREKRNKIWKSEDILTVQNTKKKDISSVSSHLAHLNP